MKEVNVMTDKKPTPQSILIVDDELIVRESLTKWFRQDGYRVESAEDAPHALKLMNEGPWDLALLDIKMPGLSGLDLQKRLKEIDKNIGVIMITAFASVESAVQALKEGAFDYVTKPIDPDHLSHIVSNALKHKKIVEENIQLREQMSDSTKAADIVGDSQQIHNVINLAKTVAKTDTTVMLRGESGTGKELIARAIHANSDRRYFPIIAVNCGAVTESLLESELFGHEKGAFTGAQYRRKGKFELADGGTIFLDEIGKQFTRVGGSDSISSDFRIICATNRDLEAALKDGSFREDLYYRLNVFTISIPPLRERRSDIPLLAEYFRSKYAAIMHKAVTEISPNTMDIMVQYDWPGNVRELENVMERAMVLAVPPAIQHTELPFQLASKAHGLQADSLAVVERAQVEMILNRTGWNISRAADILDIDRVTLYNKIAKYGLKRP
jgi:DNA-binding NtrC family response regulator